MRYIVFLISFMLHTYPESLSIKKESHSTLKVHKNIQQTISLKNSITPEMLTCNHWTGNHKPESFSLIVNGTPLQEGETKKITSDNNEVEINYHYSFAKGLYKGSRTCKVQIPTNATACSLAFSWKKEPRVWLERQG